MNRIGAMLLGAVLASPAWADDTADTGADTGADSGDGERDTDPHLDTGAVSEQVYVEDVGCAAVSGSGGLGAVAAALSLCAAAAWRRGERG